MFTVVGDKLMDYSLTTAFWSFRGLEHTVKQCKITYKEITCWKRDKSLSCFPFSQMSLSPLVLTPLESRFISALGVSDASVHRWSP